MPERHDLLLGQVAIDRGFIQPEDLDYCLQEQKESDFPIPLGAVLFSHGYVTPSQLKDLLVEQKVRFADAAMNTIFRDEDALFGQLLVRCHLITREQLNEALRLQGEREELDSPESLRLGEILIELEYLTQEDIRNVLRLQRKQVLYCTGCDLNFLVPLFNPMLLYNCRHCGRRIVATDAESLDEVDEDFYEPEETRDLLAQEAIDESSTERKPFGNYVLLEELGRGGMGRVYKAWDRKQRRVMAIKILMTQRDADEGPSREEVRAFEREAEICMKLVHANIVRIHDAGVQDGEYFVAMDYVEGVGVDRLIAHRRLTVSRSLRIISESARAIHFAHEWGVIHQDLKPSNIMIDVNNHVWVTDFGLAKEVFPVSLKPDTKALIASHVLGTPMYMAPEQAKGEVLGVNERSDVYALGATLYHMLTNQPPFDGKDGEEIVNRVVTDALELPRRVVPEIPKDVQTIVLVSMDKDARNRYANAEEMADDIDRYLDGEKIKARPAGIIKKSMYGLGDFFSG